jgi:hypothetical protein
VVAFKKMIEKRMSDAESQSLFSADSSDWNDFIEKLERSCNSVKRAGNFTDLYNWEKIIKQVVLFLKDHE